MPRFERYYGHREIIFRTVNPRDRLLLELMARGGMRVSKVVLRHANLSTTQRSLGTVSDVEALRWIGNAHS